MENPPTGKPKYTIGYPSETLQKISCFYFLGMEGKTMMTMFCDKLSSPSLSLPPSIWKWIPLNGGAQISIEKGSHLSPIILLDWSIWRALDKVETVKYKTSRWYLKPQVEGPIMCKESVRTRESVRSREVPGKKNPPRVYPKIVCCTEYFRQTSTPWKEFVN